MISSWLKLRELLWIERFKKASRQIDRKAHSQSVSQSAGRQAGRKAGRQVDRRAGRQVRTISFYATAKMYEQINLIKNKLPTQKDKGTLRPASQYQGSYYFHRMHETVLFIISIRPFQVNNLFLIARV